MLIILYDEDKEHPFSNSFFLGYIIVLYTITCQCFILPEQLGEGDIDNDPVNMSHSYFSSDVKYTSKAKHLHISKV